MPGAVKSRRGYDSPRRREQAAETRRKILDAAGELDYPGTSLSSLSWVLNAYTIVFAAVLVPAGRWADRIGRRRLFSGGLILFSCGTVLRGLSPGWPR